VGGLNGVAVGNHHHHHSALHFYPPTHTRPAHVHMQLSPRPRPMRPLCVAQRPHGPQSLVRCSLEVREAVLYRARKGERGASSTGTGGWMDGDG
jgi:hypothetical protein